MQALHCPPVSDRHAGLPGSPKRELREYASLPRTPSRIPSAHASGFKGIGQIPSPVAAVSDRRAF
jgi:hypothetical protein